MRLELTRDIPLPPQSSVSAIPPRPRKINDTSILKKNNRFYLLFLILFNLYIEGRHTNSKSPTSSSTCPGNPFLKA